MADANSEAATAALLAQITKPLKVAGDAGSFEMHTLDELIAADKYFAGRGAVTKASRGLRFTKLVPPGAV